ncbi:MAG: hypothetical protein KC486_19835 [Myxococcales bacterium]|nr:hypothetical protein [Myxococcales bacterium]
MPETPSPPPIEDHSVGLLADEVREAEEAVVLTDDAPDTGNYPRGTFRSTIAGMITVIVMIAATYVVPGLDWARPWTTADPVPFWNLIGREFLGEGEEAAAADAETRKLAELARAEVDTADSGADVEPFVEPEVAEPEPEDAPIPAYAAHADDDEAIERRLENPRRLDRFYAALARTDLRMAGAVTRASHYGDSAIGNDGITAAIRAKLQARFGDAGHGFHLLGQPNASYRHVGVKVDEKSPWHHCFIIQGCRSDGHYGFGGTTFESTGGAEIVIGTANKGAMGRKVRRFEVYFAAAPRGGNLRLKLDDQEPILLSTAADALEDRWHTIEADDGEHRLSIRAAGGGKVRAYGVTLERDGPGVVWDGLSQIGALTRRMLNWDKEHIRAQVAHRDPDLVVLMFGGNDMNMRGGMEKYKGELTEVVELFLGKDGEEVNGGNPPACLIMAPLDHGERKGQQIVTREIVPRLVEAQREVAEAAGCAFFDTYAAMGGDGSMGRWSRANPRLGSGDLSHLTLHGHKVIGAMVYRALMDGYRDFRGRVEGKPMRALAAIADHGVAVAAVDEVDLDALVGEADDDAAAGDAADAKRGGDATASDVADADADAGEADAADKTNEVDAADAEPSAAPVANGPSAAG